MDCLGDFCLVDHRNENICLGYPGEPYGASRRWSASPTFTEDNRACRVLGAEQPSVPKPRDDPDNSAERSGQLFEAQVAGGDVAEINQTGQF